MKERGRYYRLILLLAIVVAASAAAIVLGEFSGRWLLGGTALGVILLAYAFILILLRKGEVIQGR